MLYQVVTHDTLAKTWHRVGDVRPDWQSAKWQLDFARSVSYGKEVYAISGDTEAELERKFAALQNGIEPKIQTIPADMSGEDWRRWEIEMGKGGDKNRPYIYSVPPEMPVWMKWLGMWKRVIGGELGGDQDGTEPA